MQMSFLDRLALFSVFLGLTNFSKNEEQVKTQKEIIEKLDYIIERLKDV